MMEHEDWLFRPVLRGLIKGESLFDGSLSLAQVALLNEAIDVDLENQYRHRQYLKSKEERSV
jgi:hypothetical protein